MPWKRPASVPVGQVWLRFKGRERDGEPAKMYQIRDMDENIRKTCLDMMQETFLRDEDLCAALNIPEDPASVSTIRANWEGFVSQQVSLACYTEVDGNPDELVGFNNIIVKSLDDGDEDMDNVKGEPWKKLLQTLTRAEGLVNVFKHYNVDKYLSSSGLTVVPKFRGQNIGLKFFEAREPMCKAFGIDATATVFTALTSQALAKKAGYEVLAEMPYSDMLQYGIDYSMCKTPSAKVMGTKFYHDQIKNNNS